MLGKILIKRLGIIPIKRGGEVTPVKKVTFFAGAAGLGYEFKNSEIYNDSVLDIFDEVLETLTEIRGGNVGKVPLFEGFPENIPGDKEYFEKRVCGFVGNFLGMFHEGRELENGVIVPEWLFDCDQFGADPITQFQDAGLFDAAIERQKSQIGDTHVEWQTLECMYEDEALEKLQEYLMNILYSKSSIKEALHEELHFLLDHFGVESLDFTKIVFKEIQVFVSKYLWVNKEFESLSKLIKTPTDILRLFAILSNSDISLATAITFPKLKRPERRFILSTLENSGNLTNDFYKYSGLWKRLGEYLHPGEYAKKYPHTFEYFQKLRDDTLETFEGELQKCIREKNIEKILKLVSPKSGIFARKLHEILEIACGTDSMPAIPIEKGGIKISSTQKVLDAFEKGGEKIELKNLLVMKSYFDTIENSKYRTVINKKGKIKVLENKQNRLTQGVDTQVVELLERLIIKKLEKDSIFAKETEKEDIGGNVGYDCNRTLPEKEKQKIYVAEALRGITIPLSSRKALDGYYTCGRGSRFPLDMTKTLRLFSYWKEAKERTDLDLSVIFFNSELELVGHVSYTQLNAEGVVHSGDVQSAPHGAVEYVDIDLQKLALKKTKVERLKDTFFSTKKGSQEICYIAVQIYKYSGDNFEDIECFAGWQIREDSNSNVKSFDEKTVANKFDLYGKGGYFMPIIVDLVSEQIVYTDLEMNAADNYNNVEGSEDIVKMITSEVLQFSQKKPNIYDLVDFHIQSQNLEKVEDKQEADIVCDVLEGDYNIKNAEKILSELL